MRSEFQMINHRQFGVMTFNGQTLFTWEPSASVANLI